MFASIDLLRARREGVPSHPGWWGFVFPLGAMALAIAAIGEAVDVTGILFVSSVVAAITIVVWAMVAVRTVRLLGAK